MERFAMVNENLPIPQTMQDKINSKYEAAADFAERLTGALGVTVISTVHTNLYDPPRLTFSFKEEDATKLLQSSRSAIATGLSNDELLAEIQRRMGQW